MCEYWITEYGIRILVISIVIIVETDEIYSLHIHTEQYLSHKHTQNSMVEIVKIDTTQRIVKKHVMFASIFCNFTHEKSTWKFPPSNLCREWRDTTNACKRKNWFCVKQNLFVAHRFRVKFKMILIRYAVKTHEYSFVFMCPDGIPNYFNTRIGQKFFV